MFFKRKKSSDVPRIFHPPLAVPKYKVGDKFKHKHWDFLICIEDVEVNVYEKLSAYNCDGSALYYVSYMNDGNYEMMDITEKRLDARFKKIK